MYRQPTAIKESIGAGTQCTCIDKINHFIEIINIIRYFHNQIGQNYFQQRCPDLSCSTIFYHIYMSLIFAKWETFPTNLTNKCQSLPYIPSCLANSITEVLKSHHLFVLPKRIKNEHTSCLKRTK